jgi:hypothetical protein
MRIVNRTDFVPDSALCARAILEAWLDRSSGLLRERLSQAAALNSEEAEDSAEAERIELLGSIVIRVQQDPNSAVFYMPLLRRLATHGTPASSQSRRPSSDWS